jgi:hypothetical protein
VTGTPRPCYRSISIVADGRLEVCDGAHWAFVMKKVKGPALRFAIGRATRRRGVHRFLRIRTGGTSRLSPGFKFTRRLGADTDI